MKKKKKCTTFLLKNRILYIITVFLIAIGLFVRNLFVRTTKRFRQSGIASVCIFLLMISTMVHGTFSYMYSFEKEEHALSIQLEGDYVQVKKGYQGEPTIPFTIRNTGKKTLNGIQTLLTKKEIEIRYPEYEKVWLGEYLSSQGIEQMPKKWSGIHEIHELLQYMISKKEDTKELEYFIHEKMQEPLVLEPEKELKAEAILQRDRAVGTYSDCIRVKASELSKSVEEDISFTVCEETTATGSAVTLSPTMIPTAQVTASVSQLPEETIEPKVPIEPSTAPTIVPNATVIPKEYPTNTPKLGQNIRIALTERIGGVEKNNICYGIDSVTWRFKIISDESTEGYLFYYEYQGKRQLVEVKDNQAEVTLDEMMSGEVSFYCANTESERSNTISQYVILDSAAPEMTLKKVSDSEGAQKVKVEIVEDGETWSGLSSVTAQMDQQDISLENIEMQDTNLDIGNKAMAIAKRTFYLVLPEDTEEHQFFVSVQDMAGNGCEKSISVQRDDGSDVIAVTIPTEFNIYMNPLDQENQIYSDPIPITNHSEFDVNVDISSVQVNVNQNDKKNKKCLLNMSIKKEGKIIETKKNIGAMLDVTSSFTLEQREKRSDVISSQIDFLPNGVTRQVMPTNSTDEKNSAYVIFNGTLEKGTEELWGNGDLQVSVVFDFSKR